MNAGCVVQMRDCHRHSVGVRAGAGLEGAPASKWLVLAGGRVEKRDGRKGRGIKCFFTYVAWETAFKRKGWSQRREGSHR